MHRFFPQKLVTGLRNIGITASEFQQCLATVDWMTWQMEGHLVLKNCCKTPENKNTKTAAAKIPIYT